MPLPNWIQSLAGGLLGSLQSGSLPDPDTPRRVANQFGQWAAHLGRNGSLSWGPYLFGSHACLFEDCDADALGPCIKCGDPCCLAHAHVSHRGELLCDECVEKALGTGRKKSRVNRAFEYFNLLPTALLEDVNAIYRVRSKNEHPDQGGGGMVEMNQHRDVLLEHFQKRKAA